MSLWIISPLDTRVTRKMKNSMTIVTMKLALRSVSSVDNVSVDGSDINEGTNCDFVYCTVSRLLYKQLKHLFNLISIQLF